MEGPLKLKAIASFSAWVLFAFAVQAKLAPSGGDDYAAITAAITALGETGGTVELGSGIFNVSSEISITTPVTIKGAGRDSTTVKQSTTSGNVRRVFHLNHANAVVRDVTITGGYVYNTIGGAGVLIDSNGGQVLDCRVTGNTLNMNAGGAVYIQGDSGFVARTIIDRNKNTHEAYPYPGTGIYMTKGRVESCLVYSNYANGTSRTMPTYSSVVGGIYAVGGTVSNCTVVANTGRNAAGLYAKNASTKIVNCIISGNLLASTEAGVSRPGAPEWDSDGQAVFQNCLFLDPGFEDAASYDYRPVGTSTAIDAGVDGGNLASATDVLGHPRVVRVVDLGCYENQDAEDSLLITAAPEAYGVVSPAYGTVSGLAAGETRACTAPASFEENGMTITCQGWKLYSQNDETLAWSLTDESGADDKTACAYTHPTPAARTKLVWQWHAACLVTASAADGGAVSPASQILAYGETATITATPESSDVLFSRWTGDVPAGMERDNPLVFTAFGARALTAHFVARTTYVTPVGTVGASPEKPYKTPATAATSIFDFLNDLIDGCEVILLDGEHTVSAPVVISRAVVFKGENGRDQATVRQTLPSGDVRRVFELNHKDATLNGLTITGGYVYNAGNDGAGVLIGANGGKVLDCRITGNEASMNSRGGGICIASANGIVSRTIVDNNKNINNYASPGAGIYMTAGHVDNCLFYGNTMKGTSRAYNMAAALSASGGTVSNCTFSANVGRGAGGVEASGAAQIVNCIIAGNTISSYNTIETGAPEWRGIASCYVNCLVPSAVNAPNETCVQGDARFVDAANADYHLDVGSAAIKAGVVGGWTEDDTDLDGEARLSGGKIDIGCYTYISTGFACAIDASSWKVLAGSSVTFYARLDESVTASDYNYAWTVTNSLETVEFTSAEQNPVFTFTAAGRYSARLVMTDKTSGDQVFAGEKSGELVVVPLVAYVAVENENAAYPFDTESTAATNVVDALADLMDGSTLQLSEGIHVVTQEVQILDAIAIRGKGRDVTTITIESGLISRVVLLNNAAAVLADVTVTGGKYNVSVMDNGAGVKIGDAGGIVEDCRITGNSGGMNCKGDGVAVMGANAVLRRCIVDRNVNNTLGARGGGGIYVTAGTVESCLVVSNAICTGVQSYDFAPGGGIFAAGGTVRHCTVSRNFGLSGGGIYAEPSAAVENCIVADNSLWPRDQRPTTSASGDRTYPDPEYETPEWAGTAANFLNCLMPDSPDLDDSVKVPNATCIMGDPSFKDIEADNFRLEKGSAAINTGLYAAWMDTATDLDGQPRVKNYKNGVGFVDIGCYESVNKGSGTVILIR